MKTMLKAPVEFSHDRMYNKEHDKYYKFTRSNRVAEGEGYSRRELARTTVTNSKTGMGLGSRTQTKISTNLRGRNEPDTLVSMFDTSGAVSKGSDQLGRAVGRTAQFEMPSGTKN